MAEVVVDASVVAKWYIPEQHHREARALRDDYLDGQFDVLAPALMPFEAVNALKYSGFYDGERLEEAARSLSEYGIDLRSFGETGAVGEVATDLDVTIYDAAYIALARTLDSKVYTADGNLLDDLDGDYSELAAHIRTYARPGGS